MKVKVPLLLLLVLAAVAGYLIGTESGQERRERLLVRLGRAEADAATAVEVAEAVLDSAADD